MAKAFRLPRPGEIAIMDGKRCEVAYNALVGPLYNLRSKG